MWVWEVVDATFNRKTMVRIIFPIFHGTMSSDDLNLFDLKGRGARDLVDAITTKKTRTPKRGSTWSIFSRSAEIETLESISNQNHKASKAINKYSAAA